MIKRICLLVLAVLSVPAAALQPVRGIAFAAGQVDVGFPRVSDYQSDDPSWLGTPIQLAAAATASVVAPSGTPISVSTSNSATWASPLAGTFDMLDFTVTDTATAGVDLGQRAYISGFMAYFFTPEGDGDITISFDFNIPDVLRPWTRVLLSYDGQGGSEEFLNASLPLAGTLTRHYVLGQASYFALTYLFEYAPDSPLPPDSPIVGTATGHFDWSINEYPHVPTSVPEPASWTLMIAGFGLAGVALRRRRRSQLV